MVNEQSSPLFDLPAEVRTMIYCMATSRPEKIIVRGPHCATPPLAQTCRQLRAEVIPTWLENNTFKMTNLVEIRKWLPLNSATLSLINSITLDLDSSILWHHTLKHYDIQPTRFVNCGEKATADEAGVVWASHARILESLATKPRRGAIKSISELNGLLSERRVIDVKRMRKKFAGLETD